VADYRLQFTSSAEKELHRQPAAMLTRIASRIDRLAAQPRPQGCKKLRGGVNEWRIRIGDYRVIYTISDAERVIDITRIAHRKEVYEP
jgi:mRNA interferase RelE/StbE